MKRQAFPLLRRAALALHLWGGLILGVYWSALGVTGAVLVFRPEIDAALTASLRRVAPPPRAVRLPLDRQAAAALAANPGLSLIRVQPASHSGEATLFVVGSGGGCSLRDVFVDPYSAKITGERLSGGAFFNFVHSLHGELLMGKRGQTANGVCGLAAAILPLSGLWLWWPQTRNFRKTAWTKMTLRRGASFRRALLDVHNAAGFYSALFLIVIALTGASLVFRDQTMRAVSALTGTPAGAPAAGARMPDRRRAGSPPAKGASLDRMADLARPAAPGLAIREIDRDPDGGWRVVEGSAFDHDIRPLLTSVAFAPSGDKITAVRRGATGPLGMRIMAWLGAVHVGRFAPGALYYPVKALYVFLGLAPGALFITGALMYAKQLEYRAKSRRDAKTAAGSLIPCKTDLARPV